MSLRLLLVLLMIAGPGANVAWANLCSELGHVQKVDVPIEIAADFNPNPFKTNEVYLKDQVEVSKNTILKAIGAKYLVEDAHPGSIFASPSNIDGGQNYQFNWKRDAALVTRVLIKIWIDVIKTANKDLALSLQKTLIDIVDFDLLTMSHDNKCGQAWDEALVNAKSYLNGLPYVDPWAWHQSDGPALTAVTQIKLAEKLIELGQMDLVKQKLYDLTPGAHTAITANLDIIVKVFNKFTNDYWEERDGFHFPTSLAHLDAMTKGQAFALKMGDIKRAEVFGQTAEKIRKLMAGFYADTKLDYIPATIGKQHWNYSGRDVEVILGVNESGPDVGDFSPLDERVLQHQDMLVDTFDGIYEINKTKVSQTGEELGTAIGRNPEDPFDGYKFEPGVRFGNPWFLATLAFAEFHYKFERSLYLGRKIMVTNRNLRFFKRLKLAKEPKLGEVFTIGTKEFSNLIEANRKRAATYIARVKQHVGKNGEMSEQFNRIYGTMQGVENLTWSHAAVVSLSQLMSEVEGAHQLINKLIEAKGPARGIVLKEILNAINGTRLNQVP